MSYNTKSKEELIAEVESLREELRLLKVNVHKEEGTSTCLSGIPMRKTEFDLRERLKELNCRDQISLLLSNEELSVEEAVVKIANLLLPAFQYPALANASLQIRDIRVDTPGFREGITMLEQAIVVNQQTMGRIRVAYPDLQLPNTETVFLPEEKKLLFSVAHKLGNFVVKKEQTAALEHSRDLYQNLIDNINDVIYEIDEQGTILFVSPSVEKVLGFRDHELVGKNFRTVMGESEELLTQRFGELPFKKEIQHEYSIYDKNGCVRWIRLSTKAKFLGDRFIGGLGTLIDITEKKEAELRLAQSEELFRNIVENIKDVIYEVSPQGTVLFVSPSIERFLGFRPEELTGKPFWQFICKEDRQGVIDKFSRFEKKEYEFLEYRYLSKNGELRWARSSTNPVYENGQLIKGRGILIDIHDRKMAEEQLRQSEELYRNLVESINDVIYEVSSSGLIKYVSPAIERVVGYRPDELIGKNFFDFLYPADRAILAEAFAMLGQQDYSSLEYRYITKEGKICWIRSSSKAMLEDGRVVGGKGVLIDITKQKEAQALLESSQQTLKIFVEHAPAAIAMFDQQMRYMACSKRYLTDYQLGQADLIGQLHYEIFPDIPEDWKKVHQQCLAGATIRSEQDKFIHSDGSMDWVRWEIHPWYNNRNEIGGIFLFSEVITERIKAEEQLRQLSQAVEQSPVSIVITDPDGSIEYANPKACETTGYSLDELQHQNPRVLKSGEIGTEEYQQLWQTITAGNTWQGTFHNKKKDGGLYWEAATIAPIIDPAGQITHFLAIKQDITEATRIQEELKKSEERFSQIAEESHTVIWEVDQNGLYTYVSPLSERVWGYSPEDMVGKMSFYDLFPSEECQELKSEALNYFTRKESFRNFLNPLIRKDGSKILVLTNGSPVIGASGILLGYRGADNDVTEQKAAEEALRQSEANLNYAQEIARMGSWEYNFRNNSTTWSDSMYRLLRLEKGQIVPDYQYVLDHVHPDDLKLFNEGEDQIAQSGQALTFDFRMLRADGEYRWFTNNIVPVFEGQTIVGLRGINVDITEKKLDEEQFRQQNERMSAIIDAIPDLIFITNCQGTYLEAFNARNARLLYPFDKLIGVSVNEVFSPAVAQLHLQKIAECLERQELITFDYSVQKDDGDRYFEARLVPLGKEQVLKFVRDFTELRQRENEIKKLSLAIEQSPVVTVITDPEARVEYVNKAFESVTGYTFGEVAGKSISLLKSGLTERSVYADLWRNLKEGKDWHNEWMNRKKNGELYWESIYISPVHNQDGVITNYMAVKQDITERKRIEETLKQSEEKYRFMFINNPQPMWIYDLTTLKFLEINNAAILHYGYSREEFLSMTLKEIRPQEDLTALLADLDQTEKKLNSAGEWRHLKKNGEIIQVEIISHAIIYNGHEARHVLVNDITERKRIEEEIRDLNATLEERIAERTSQLAEINDSLMKQMEIRRLAEQNLEMMSTRLKLALRVAKVGVWDYDIANDYLLWDKQMFLMYGVQEERFDGHYQTWQTILHPDDLERSVSAFQRALTGEAEYDTEFRVVWPDGSFRLIKAMAIIQRASDGTPVHMIGANWDITDQRRAADFEKELLQLAPKLTGVTRSEINAAIRLALSRIGQSLSADRAYIFEFDTDLDTMTNSFEWCNEGITPQIGSLQHIPNEIFPQWMETLRHHENIIIPLVGELPENWSAEREILEPQGIKSLIAMPLLFDQKLIGFVGLDSVSAYREYKPAEINILKVWSSMLASLLNNQRIETRLEQTRQNYETFFNTIDDFLWVFDTKSRILHFNQTAENRLGYTGQELTGHPADILHPNERKTEVLQTIAHILNGDTDHCAIPLVTKSGQQIPVETRVKPGFWNGTPVLFGVSKDMTQIQLSEQKFSRAFQTSPAMMAVSNFISGEFIDVNNAFLENFGYTRSEILGKTNRELHILPDNQLREKIISRLDRGEEVRKMEIRMQSKEGKLKTGLLSADSIYIGDTRCLLTVTLDITERIRVEEELKKARTEAEEANLAKSEFLSRMSHELRTPMNSILGFAQLLEMGGLNPAQMKGVGHILKSGKHLLELINEVLDISRIEAGRLSLSLEPVHLGGILRETIDLVTPLSLPYHVHINLDSDIPNELYIRADRQLLKQVLINLLNNAIKYNHSNGTVTIGIEHHPTGYSANAMIRIAITDTGHGIPEADLPKLFIPFERIGAEKTRIEGSGLGLSVAKKLTEAMGGKIGVESRIGKGSTFWIELPNSANQQIQRTEVGSSGELSSSSHPKVGTILYIEDNAPNIELAEQIIAAHRPGIQLICNSFGRQSLSLAIAHRPDLILLDLNLVDMHGSEVLARLKKDPETSTIPVVIISADAMSTQMNKLLKSGADKYLTKPLDISVLLKVIDEYIAG